jgi:hypothetical protein
LRLQYEGCEEENRVAIDHDTFSAVFKTKTLDHSMSAELDLEEAILDSELRYVNFFNGRLLTGGDLRDEQAANRACSRHLGQAVGSGVAYGLEATISPGSLPTDALVDIAAGVALNHEGQTLHLKSRQTVALVRPPDQRGTADCVFVDCQPLPAGTTLSSAGYYLLTIAPASAREGLAPASGLGSVVGDCNSRYFVEGVQFRLLPLNVTRSDNPNLERNSVAYQCFGLPGFGPGDFLDATSASSPAIVYGVETLVPAGRLTTRDVPLAVIEWTIGGLGFIDQWSVRRRVTHPNPSGRWEYFTGDRRRSEGEAMFLQFQEQFATLETGTSPPPGLTADSVFRFLPPAGILPDPDGTIWRAFLGPLGPTHETEIDASLWPRLLRESFTLEPVQVPAFSSATAAIGIARQARAVLGARRFAAARPFGSFARAQAGVTMTGQVVSPAEPPTPLKIYRVPGRNEVLFIRSRLGRVRILLPRARRVEIGLQIGIQVAGSNILLFATAPQLPSSEFVIDDVPAGTHPIIELFSKRDPESSAQQSQLIVSDFTVVVVEGRTTDWKLPVTTQRPRVEPDRSVLFGTGQFG